MGKKLTDEQLKLAIEANPHSAQFDQCVYCNGIEHYHEQGLVSEDNDSFDTICDECRNEFDVDIKDAVDDGIDEMFETAHDLYRTKTGDVTPYQYQKIEHLKSQILEIVMEQTKQNL